MLNLLTVNPIYIHVLWAVVAVAMIVLEFYTEDFTSIWFGIGAIVALILSLCGIDSFLLQFGVFLGVSIILLLCLRKILKKFFIKKTVATNTDALIGQKVVVLKDADSLNSGEGKVNGLVWTIICEDDNVVKKDDVATIVKIVGNKLVVKN